MIRPLLPEDAEHAAALIRSAFAAIDQPLDPPPSALRVTGEVIRGHLGAGGGGALHGVSGCVLWMEREGSLHLSRLAVLPEARRQGIAAALLRHAETIGHELGLTHLRLEVRLALPSNRRLFRAAGFTERTQHAHPGFDRPTYAAAEKRLLPPGEPARRA